MHKQWHIMEQRITGFITIHNSYDTEEEAIAAATALIGNHEKRQLYIAKLTKCLAYVETEIDTYVHTAEFI